MVRSFCLRVSAFPFGAVKQRSLPSQSFDTYSYLTCNSNIVAQKANPVKLYLCNLIKLR